MKKIFIGLRNFDFPNKWNELTKEQLLYISKLLSVGYSKEEMVVILTSYFSKKNINELEKINPLIFVEMEHQFNFLFQDMKLTNQLLPEIRFGMKKYVGPEKGLPDFTYERFIIFAETYFDKYIETEEEQYLDSLIATLYIRKGEEFSGEKIETKNLKKLSTAYKYAILLFYQGNRSLIASRFPRLFPKKTSKKKQNYDFLGVMELLNNGDISKNNEIKKVNIYEVFTRLTKMLEDGSNNK